MSGHHVETWIGDTWGWQCFTCGAEDDGYPSLAKAETAGERHAREAVAS